MENDVFASIDAANAITENLVDVLLDLIKVHYLPPLLLGLAWTARSSAIKSLSEVIAFL
jgi:hypothetical protein